jgi:hypothetical protein
MAKAFETNPSGVFQPRKLYWKVADIAILYKICRPSNVYECVVIASYGVILSQYCVLESLHAHLWS